MTRADQIITALGGNPNTPTLNAISLPNAGGLAFPSAANDRDVFFNTTYMLRFYFENVTSHDWLTTHGYQESFVHVGTALPFAATVADAMRHSNPGSELGLDPWVNGLEATFLVNGGTALGASHKWVGVVSAVDASNALTTVGTFTINSGSSSVWRKLNIGVDAAYALATYYSFVIAWTKTGTPGNLYVLVDMKYRLIGT
jgi:hypothetical protein